MGFCTRKEVRSIKKCRLRSRKRHFHLDGSINHEKFRIKSIDDAGFGAMTIEDPTGTLSVYGTYSSDGVKRYSELDEKTVKGDTVLLYGTIQNYKNNKERMDY